MVGRVLLALYATVVVALSLGTRATASSVSPSCTLNTSAVRPASAPVFSRSSLTTCDTSLSSLTRGLFVGHGCVPYSSLPSAMVSYSSSVCVRHLRSLPCVVRVACGPVIEGCVRVCTHHPHRVTAVLTLKRRCFPLFRRGLRRCKLPLRLHCLPVVRDTLGPRTASPMNTTKL